jgi:hypothetical protein
VSIRCRGVLALGGHIKVSQGFGMRHCLSSCGDVRLVPLLRAGGEGEGVTTRHKPQATAADGYSGREWLGLSRTPEQALRKSAETGDGPGVFRGAAPTEERNPSEGSCR